MKKIVFLFVALFITVSLSAQDWGVRAGADFASTKLKFDGDSESDSGTGFYLGFFGSFNISESFAFRPEINYVGVEVEDVKLGHISVPLLADFRTSDTFHILVGPEVGFMTGDEEGMDSVNFALNFGLAYDFSDNLAVEARYNLGLANLADSEMDIFDIKYKLSGFFLGFGYTF